MLEVKDVNQFYGGSHILRDTVPELAHLPAGCPFAGRCGFTMDACHTTPPPPVPLGALGALGAGHMARCIRLDAMPAAPEVGA